MRPLEIAGPRPAEVRDVCPENRTALPGVGGQSDCSLAGRSPAELARGRSRRIRWVRQVRTVKPLVSVNGPASGLVTVTFRVPVSALADSEMTTVSCVALLRVSPS